MDCGEKEYSASVSPLFETVDEIKLPKPAIVQGDIPTWLSGEMLRNGPALFEVGDKTVNHFFDGFAQFHRFTIKEGKVTYDSRYLNGEAYSKSMELRRFAYSGFGTIAYPDPCKNIFRRFFSYFTPKPPSDNNNVNFMQVGDAIYALSETNVLRRVDPKTLETKEKVDLMDYVSVQTSTAHPHVDYDGTTYNMGSSFGPTAFYNLVKFPSQSNHNDNEVDAKKDPLAGAEIICKIQAPSLYPSYYHSFGITENYMVFLEQSLTLSVPKAILSICGWKTFSDCTIFDEKRKGRFYIINRSDCTVVERQYITDPCVCFHFINTYEDNGALVVDLVGYDDASFIHETYLKPLRDGATPTTTSTARRYVLPLEGTLLSTLNSGEKVVRMDDCGATAEVRADGSVYCKPGIVYEGNLEMPRINYDRFNGKKYRYFYALSGDTRKLLKCDTKTHKCVAEFADHDSYPSEPVFVPRPGGFEEDDGVVLSVVNDLHDGRRGYLLILDAKTFAELARADVPGDAVPYLIHGIFKR